MQLLTIHDAAKITGKSIQTIRRMIKQKKIHVKRQKTPQGFNYLIVHDSLLTHLNQANQTTTRVDLTTREGSREHRPITQHADTTFKAEFDRLSTTIQRLIEQHEKDKSNLFQLIKTFQDRVFVLENHIKLLEAPKPRFWQFWK